MSVPSTILPVLKGCKDILVRRFRILPLLEDTLSLILLFTDRLLTPPTLFLQRDRTVTVKTQYSLRSPSQRDNSVLTPPQPLSRLDRDLEGQHIIQGSVLS